MTWPNAPAEERHQSMLSLYPDQSETIEGTGEALRAGKTSCAAVLQKCLDQIEEWEPNVKAWVVIDREAAKEQAREWDEELAQGKCRGPLHGIPFGIKDIIDVKGLPTVCGFEPWRDRIAEKDATVVEQLRDAGAVILGKTVTTQFAWIDPPVTRNPWNLERTPGGSSSGSAAAVATGMCLAAMGTQTGGSIIRPASFCGVAGFKPRHGSISMEGILRFSESFDNPGPIARTVSDLRLVADTLLVDHRRYFPPWFPYTVGTASQTVSTALSILRVPPKLLRPRGFFERRADPEMLVAFDKALSILQAAGAEINDLDDDAIDFESVLTKHRTVMAAEAANEHETRFAEHHDQYSKHIRALVEEGMKVPATRYIGCLRYCRENCDPSKFLVTPAAVGPAPDTSTTGNPCMNSPFSFFGMGVVSFPIALSAEGLPLAIQLASDSDGTNDDRDLLSAASWCEYTLRRAHDAGSD